MIGSYELNLDVAARLDLVAHRGPDGSGVATAGPAVHGHVRLALLDLTDASAQPYRFGGGVLSFVGEVWNWREVARQLAEDGVASALGARSDTQVLAAALAAWGVAATLPRLEGMFAFAWSREGTRTHVLARDRFGKVPLYVHREAQGGGFAWSSERKGLPGLACRPLPPGSWLDLRTGQLTTWYSLPDPPWAAAGATTEATPERQPGDNVAEAIRADLREGVRRRLVADAPLCVLCSGGLDSTLVLAMAKAAKPDVVAFTAVMSPFSPDLRAARRACAEFEVPLVEVPVPEPTRELLAEAARAIEIPMKAQVEIAALCLPLARAIRSHGFKACLSGEAADELFGGYGSMCIQGAGADDALWRLIRVKQLEKMSRGNFVRCNKAFMAGGVECRLPYMERALVERAINLGRDECPPGKGALKRAAEGVAPAWVIRRQKETFQGASGLAEAAARALPDVRRFYGAEVRSAFGEGVRG